MHRRRPLKVYPLKTLYLNGLLGGILYSIPTLSALTPRVFLCVYVLSFPFPFPPMVNPFLFIFPFTYLSHSRIWPKKGKSPATFTEMDTAWVIGRLLSAISLCHAQVKERERERERERDREGERMRDILPAKPSHLPILFFCPLPTSYPMLLSPPHSPPSDIQYPISDLHISIYPSI